MIASHDNVLQRSRLFGAVCVLGCALPLRAQPVHPLRWGLDGAIVGGSVAVHSVLFASQLGRQLDTGPVAVMDRSLVNGFDRVATYRYSERAAKTSDRLFMGALVFPLVAAIMPNPDGPAPVLLTAESFLVTSALTNLAKFTVRRPRPYRYNPDAPSHLHYGKESRLSFWSGHTANCAAITFTVANMVQHHDLTRDQKTAVWIGAAAVPALMGYLRVRAGKHFPTDVVVGYGAGAALGWLIPYLHRSER